MTPNEMLKALSAIWLSYAGGYMNDDYEDVLKHIEALQEIIFKLEE